MPRQLSVDFQRFKSLTILFDDNGPTSINVQYELRGNGVSVPKAQNLSLDELTTAEQTSLKRIVGRILARARQVENV